MNRREFIGGCAAGAVAAGLPAENPPHQFVAGASLITPPFTIPLGSVIYACMDDINGGNGFANIDGGDGRLARIGVRLARDRFGTLTAYNTGRVVG